MLRSEKSSSDHAQNVQKTAEIAFAKTSMSKIMLTSPWLRQHNASRPARKYFSIPAPSTATDYYRGVPNETTNMFALNDLHLLYIKCTIGKEKSDDKLSSKFFGYGGCAMQGAVWKNDCISVELAVLAPRSGSFLNTNSQLQP